MLLELSRQARRIANYKRKIQCGKFVDDNLHFVSWESWIVWLSPILKTSNKKKQKTPEFPNKWKQHYTCADRFSFLLTLPPCCHLGYQVTPLFDTVVEMGN